MFLFVHDTGRKIVEQTFQSSIEINIYSVTKCQRNFTNYLFTVTASNSIVSDVPINIMGDKLLLNFGAKFEG